MQNISTSKKAFKTAAQFSLKKDSVLKLFKHLPGTFTSKIELNTAAAAAIMIIIIIITQRTTTSNSLLTKILPVTPSDSNSARSFLR